MKIKIGNYPTHRWYHNWLYDKFGYSPKPKMSVKIDEWDTWSMDHTLAHIILPMLIQLKKTQHGAPNVDMHDVPKELRATKAQLKKYGKDGDVDPNHFARWDWILNEMIYAFDCKLNKDDVYMRFEDPDKIREEQGRISNGFQLFGKYYENLWD